MRSKKVFYNFISSFFQQIIAVIYGFILPKIILIKYGSDVNGLISSITQLLGYITLLEAGFGPVVKSALYKPISKKNKEEISNILYSSNIFFKKIALIFVVYIVLLCFLYPFIKSNTFSAIYISSLIIIISASTFCQYYFGITYQLFLQADQKNYIRSSIQIITYLLCIVSIIIMYFINCPVHIFQLICGIIFVLRPFMTSIYVKYKYNISFDKVNKNYQLKNKWDGLAQHIASVIHNNTDIALLTFFSDFKTISVYSIYRMITTGVKSLIQSFISGIDSSFGDMIAKNENEIFRNRFDTYEIIYISVITIVFSMTLLLITPFIKIYTYGINDANYVQYTFGYLFVLGEYIWAIRQPYNEIIKAAGHFKETKKGAWIECVINILVSILLIFKFGMIGVAIGTLLAMLVRTIELIIYFNRNILKRNQKYTIKKLVLCIIETVLIFILFTHFSNYKDVISYLDWFVLCILLGFFELILVLGINYMFYKDNYKELGIFIKNVLNRKKVKNNEN